MILRISNLLLSPTATSSQRTPVRSDVLTAVAMKITVLSLLYPEDGDRRFLQNAADYLPNYTAPYNSCGNLKYQTYVTAA
jgi:hypothetical protein